MNKKITLREIISYAVIIALLFMQFFKSSFIENQPKNEIKIDSILRIFETKLNSRTFKNDSPQPIINIYPSQNKSENSDLTNSLIQEFKSLKNENSKLNAFMKVIATKVYKNEYKDSLSTVTVIDTVSNGVLKNQNVKVDILPRKIKYFEKTITKKLKPKFVLSTGLGITTRLDSLAKTQLNALIGIKNKKGYEFQFGISTNKRYNFTLKKDIFVKY